VSGLCRAEAEEARSCVIFVLPLALGSPLVQIATRSDPWVDLIRSAASRTNAGTAMLVNRPRRQFSK